MERLYQGLKSLLARPERSVLVVAHGMAVEWVARSSMRSDEQRAIGLAEPLRVDVNALMQAFPDLDRDVYAYFTT